MSHLKESFQVRWDNSRVQMVQCAMLLCSIAHYHLYTAVSRENAFCLVQQNRDTSR